MNLRLPQMNWSSQTGEKLRSEESSHFDFRAVSITYVFNLVEFWKASISDSCIMKISAI